MSEPAQRAYEAAVKALGGTMPDWNDLSDGVRDLWRVVIEISKE